jgi:ketosteroid isomerase-like protein
MSKENVEIVRAIIPPPDTDLAALIRDDRLFDATAEALGQLTDPDLECVAVWQEGKTYTGVEGLRALWLDWLEPWETYHSRVEELLDAGDRVLALGRDRGRRLDMDLEVEIMAGSLWELRDSRLVRVEFFRDRDEALQAAGLSEQNLHHADS